MRRGQSRRPGIEEQGFTLVEVVLAISILTIGVLALASMQVSSIKGNATASGMTTATAWAADQMERLTALPYDDVDLDDTDGDGNGGLDDATAGTADHMATQGEYTVYWNVAVDDMVADTKTVGVIVIWADRSQQKRVSMCHVIANV